MASATGTTGRASNVKEGNIEQNLCTSSGSSHSINIYPPQSPTRMTNDWILKLAGAFHGLKTSRIRFCAFSYSMGEPCGRSFQVIMYCIELTSSFNRIQSRGLRGRQGYTPGGTRASSDMTKNSRGILVDVLRVGSGRVTGNAEVILELPAIKSAFRQLRSLALD